MMKTVAVALLVVGMLLVAVALDNSTAQAQPDGADATTKPKELVLDLGDKVTLKLLQIPAGKFLMGSPKDEKDRGDDEGMPPGKWVNGSPQFEVTISKPFYLGVYEVTVAQYAQFVKDTGQKHEEPDFKQPGDYPVVNVSWDNAQAFCAWLSKKTGKTVTLPTEAQWEYACRAGSKTRFGFGDKEEELGDYAWYDGNSMDKDKGAKMTHPVGQKKPNAWGLYDMHGNVWEWCADYYGEYTGAGADPTGPKDGGLRVLRGGSWNFNPRICRSADRDGSNPDYRNVDGGFRVAVASAGVDLP